MSRHYYWIVTFHQARMYCILYWLLNVEHDTEMSILTYFTILLTDTLCTMKCAWLTSIKTLDITCIFYSWLIKLCSVTWSFFGCMALNTNYYSVLVNLHSLIDITFLDLAGLDRFQTSRAPLTVWFLIVVIACLAVIIYGQFIWINKQTF